MKKIKTEEINKMIDFLELVKARCESGDTDDLVGLAKAHHMYDPMHVKTTLIKLEIIKKIDDAGYVFRGTITRALATKVIATMIEKNHDRMVKMVATKASKYPKTPKLNGEEVEEAVKEEVKLTSDKTIITVVSAEQIIFIDAVAVIGQFEISGTFKISKR